jgi:CDP-glucose 4,6-dehydratase
MLLAEKLADKPELAGEAFNFSNENQLTVLEIVELVLEVMHSDLKPKDTG